ncbi:hypothetical protein N7532_010073 [Penicillium argentinense]|uniref:FAS1 domain-containing protein n=1 Tax=Penicillium argentinense TaxID=1131581 RepID=A0A9W9ENW3_9EURO|nr:uncharacterized protein N7532_010073 [Penicillium argentinense]KAJ5085302.1 hypothetical protein N7532_010073 [Penicillium argentinense]
MRETRLFSSLFLLLAFITSSSALWGLALPTGILQRPLVSQYDQPIMDKIIPSILHPKTPDNNAQVDSEEPIISDVLPKTKGINIFAQLTRDFDSVSSRLNDASKNITVLAPRNSAVQDLPRKPWEDPEDYNKFGEVNAYEGQDGKDRARNNLRRFVEAHLIPVSPWQEGEEVETLGGVKLKWTKEGDKIKIQPGDIEVDNVAEKVANGEVWVLNRVINYSR